MTAKSSKRKRVVVVLPGRGSYGAAQLGYLRKHHQSFRTKLAKIDARTGENGATPARELDDRPSFVPSVHLAGRNASNLIYACALADVAAIDVERYEIVAVCGNSLGWYLTLAAGGAMTLEDGAHLVDTMGTLMEQKGEGGQVLYPVVDQDWRRDPKREADVAAALAKASVSGGAYRSIELGGIAVLAGDGPSLKVLLDELPGDGDYPLRLPRHAAFHTPILSGISAIAKARLQPSLFGQPSLPMIDGYGRIWRPYACDPVDLYGYTLGAQITQTFDFTATITTAIKEFAPDGLILTGPGNSLGAPVAQVLIGCGWRGLRSKADFIAMQDNEPFIISVGRGR
ncbi:MAG: ACP S-malonyltransferase [Pseudomonadota bacterium]